MCCVKPMGQSTGAAAEESTCDQDVFQMGAQLDLKGIPVGREEEHGARGLHAHEILGREGLAFERCMRR